MASGYQVIARRWRPKQFDELVGQEHIVRTLKNAILQNRIAHAYLFVGPRGTGKTTTARIFAKALNCDGGPSVSPDDNAPLCQAIMNGSCMDVVEIDGASNNSVDNIRQLREDCQYTPAQGKFKIYIIDEVHMLSTGAFNALLKTLEEPPEHVKFIFATTEVNKVPPTIVSRCQRFEFRPIPDEKIAEKLGQIAQAESIGIDAGALGSIARLANGGMRDAQSILDQLISFCGNTVTEANVVDVYGLAPRQQIADICAAMAKGDYAALIALADTLADEGKDLYRVLADVQSSLREALLDAVRNGGQTDRLGATMRTEPLLRMLEALHEGEGSLRTGLSEKVNFEVVLLKAVEEGRSRPIDALIKDLTDLTASLPPEAGQKKIETPPPSARVLAAETPAPQKAAEPEPAPAARVQEKDQPNPPSDETADDEEADASFETALPVAEVAAVPAPAPEPAPMPEDPAKLPSWDQIPERLKAILVDDFHATLRPCVKVRQGDLH